MVNTIAHALRALSDLAFRQVVGIVVLLCLVLGPVGSEMATHHEDDLDASIALSTGDTGGTAASHQATLIVIDHDCHGCNAALDVVRDNIIMARLSHPMDLTSEALILGQSPTAQLRPPRA